LTRTGDAVKPRAVAAEFVNDLIKHDDDVASVITADTRAGLLLAVTDLIDDVLSRSDERIEELLGEVAHLHGRLVKAELALAKLKIQNAKRGSCEQ
jgi:hypothetical protein